MRDLPTIERGVPHPGFADSIGATIRAHSDELDAALEESIPVKDRTHRPGRGWWVAESAVPAAIDCMLRVWPEIMSVGPDGDFLIDRSRRQARQASLFGEA